MRASNRVGALAAFILLCVCGCREGPGQGGAPPTSGQDNKFASPEATFQTAKAAILREDYAAFCDCWTPEGRDQLAGGMVFIGNLLGFIAKQKAEEGAPHRVWQWAREL